jgi:hypothetical protein
MTIHLDARHAGTNVARVLAVFVNAGWSDETARIATVRVASTETAQRIVSLASSLPEQIRCVLLQGRPLAGEQELASAFAEAQEIEKLTALAAKQSAPGAVQRLKTMSAYIVPTASGERLMSIAEARHLLVDTLAEQDQHIDTARPADAGMTALQAAADRRYGIPS